MGNSVSLAVVERLHACVVSDILAHSFSEVILLERPVGGELRRVRRLEAAGITIQIPSFFAGHLLSTDNESAWIAAGRVVRRIAPAIAERLVRRSPILTVIDNASRPGTLLLHLSKSLLWSLSRVAIRLEVARALAGSRRAMVWVEVPFPLPMSEIADMAPDMVVVPIRPAGSGIKELIKPLGREAMRAMKARLDFGRARLITQEPTILTVHEEDLNNDRSYRGQLHWLDTDDEAPICRVVMLPQRGVHRDASTRDSLERRRIVLLEEREVIACMRRARHSVQSRLKRWARECFWSIFSSKTIPDRFAALNAALLLLNAQRIAAVTEATGARAWVGCEGFFAEADAVNLIADECGLRTASWQYSAMMTPTQLMLTTADVMATFSEYFAPLYSPSPVGPRSLLPIGYPFEDVPRLVAARTRAVRRKLEVAGARYVVCFFDESIAHSKWHGLINADDHLAILEALAATVLRDPEFAVIFKPKYAYDAVERIHPRSSLLMNAAATGRFVHLVAGVHRNEVFAAEAAMCADLCIGFLAGATAALEGAIAGSRAVLLRHRGEIAQLDPILKEVDVVYPSIGAVLEAVQEYRDNAPARAALGDWRPVIGRLNASDGGHAPARLRALLEGWALGLPCERGRPEFERTEAAA